ncbi:T9SS type A sorting domain-containing protein [Fluviicola sp.]|uniref:T9SS type A sorting domain-containing protein n=1 Tax=Fluviicola sp. TaxID=1917219 RepID=UPI003D28D9B6
MTIYCSQKSIAQYFGVTQAIYFNNGDIEFAGLTALEDSHFSCYPNPSSSSVTIESDNNSLTKFKLFDSNGRLLENDEFYLKTSFSISEYANGVYLLYVEDNKHQSMIRIVKN